jgi:nucleotide-binding universal stress UspA family protein
VSALLFLIIAVQTTNPLQITAISVVIALLFLSSIVGVLGWMLRLPKVTEQRRTTTRAVRSVNKLAHILVPLLSRNEATDRIVALAAQMAQQRNGTVEVLAVIEVPFTLPLNAHGEDEEQAALLALDRAASVATQCIVRGTRSAFRLSKHILKTRERGVAIVREAEEQGVDLILLANTPVRVRGMMQQIDPTVEYVMRNAPCEVLTLSQGRATGRRDSVERGETESKTHAAEAAPGFGSSLP